jgi:hypothetical protein
MSVDLVCCGGVRTIIVYAFPLFFLSFASFMIVPPKCRRYFAKFVMFDMYVKLPPDASPVAVNKFYLLTSYKFPFYVIFFSKIQEFLS